MAYARVEPWGPLQDDYRAGIGAAILANVHRDTKRRPAPWGPEDFFPALAQPEPLMAEVDAEEMAYRQARALGMRFEEPKGA